MTLVVKDNDDARGGQAVELVLVFEALLLAVIADVALQRQAVRNVLVEGVVLIALVLLFFFVRRELFREEALQQRSVFGNKILLHIRQLRRVSRVKPEWGERVEHASQQEQKRLRLARTYLCGDRARL